MKSVKEFKIDLTFDEPKKSKEPIIETKKPIEKKPFLKRGDGKYCVSK